MSVEACEASEDAVLGGRLVLRQPVRGHRFGHDAILLAAATRRAGGRARGRSRRRRRRGGTGAGAPRRGACRHAGRNRSGAHGAGARQRRAQRACRRACARSVSTSRRRRPRSPPPGSLPESADRVLMNPPFNAPQNPSPERGRRSARTAPEGTLALWLGTAARLLRPSGTVTLIWRADGLGEVLAALAHRFGAISVLPIHPKPGVPAIRVLVCAGKDSSGPLSLLPGFRACRRRRQADRASRSRTARRCRSGIGWKLRSVARTIPGIDADTYGRILLSR